MAGRALPSHLKPSAAEGGEGGFAPRHHGKTQSHVVSFSSFVAAFQQPVFWFLSVWIGMYRCFLLHGFGSTNGTSWAIGMCERLEEGAATAKVA